MPVGAAGIKTGSMRTAKVRPGWEPGMIVCSP